ncbi:hypothetical protein CcI156_17130 [Frankia sp. CcI156]|jgi:hypothetical protein|uniref:Uncharacterized protein n=1 Tax=Frankia casuarinae (strain DSM 45818 / CECT 9043 / HFP020203 / CcI3) TaxID=106370 RepID=Q2J7I7_FRACC|nr:MULTISPECIES: hypothetical protein [Frankia]ABD12755.1 hypothetical protein Francci3_3401 [Frankia casuarinae]ETA01007.1 hypothetical protein CcI6DRAFT_03547 [Frankia sp. CcI6]EYT91451.1 hypothetical protein ThrDRAFT_02881 [Frankia casuarinae]KDA41906.1 hypothetical protein BMG523Draft_03296 [Frankia sp. BMG5.23]KEZ37078.1 hypothetical protein CEDDRAFT_01606 [Frankia sp. CeD]
MTADPESAWQRYTVSAELLYRDDTADALRGRDFDAAFLLMRKWDHVSQDRLASSIEGFSQSRISGRSAPTTSSTTAATPAATPPTGYQTVAITNGYTRTLHTAGPDHIIDSLTELLDLLA